MFIVVSCAASDFVHLSFSLLFSFIICILSECVLCLYVLATLWCNKWWLNYELWYRGRPNFVFFYFSVPENAFFKIFRRFIFSPKKTSTFSFSFFFGTKMAVKKQKKSQYFGWANARRAELWVTCSRIQSLSTSPPAEHEYCEAVGTEQWADSVCLCCCSRLESIAPPARKFLSAPPPSAASEQLFSAAGQIYSDRRSSLLGENAEKFLFLACSIRLFDYKYWSLHAEQLTQWAI